MKTAKLSVNSLEYQQESWAQVKDDVVSLTKSHFDECNASEGRFPFSLDEDRMAALYDSGYLQITTARDNGELVGYLANIVSRNLLYDALCSYHVGWYVSPEYRGKLTGLYLLDKATPFLRDIGVKRMYGAHTDELDASGIFKRLGWKHIEDHYSKWIGD